MLPKVIWQGTIRVSPDATASECPPGRVVAKDVFLQGAYRKCVVVEKAQKDAMNELAWFGVTDPSERDAAIAAALIDLGDNSEHHERTRAALQGALDAALDRENDQRVEIRTLKVQLARRIASGRKGKTP